ncbi:MULTISPECIES: WD40 repeat domain-containing protein [unclassified Streptomyces]|uniref:WD40 repeat domain-containing protein n=1 Tax=unclassified Streptomyces TaxID=2593676 RepID=UPI000A68ECC5|nr:MULTISPECIES: hypothetical protein [unclassified Streptomyces]
MVDQFEELFTLCTNSMERTVFLERLLGACDDDSRLRVILAGRADFFGHCAGHRELAAALKDTALLVSPLDKDQLRSAIARPAAARGLIVERDLAARIIEDVADEPGSLPLMSHALMETWRRRRGRTLTTQAGGWDRAHLVDLRTHRTLARPVTGESTMAVAFSADGRFLAAGDTAGRATLWDGQARRQLGQLPASGNETPAGQREAVTSLAYSPDAKTLGTAGDHGAVRLWDAASHHPLGGPLPTTPGAPVLALAFTPDSEALRTVGRRTPAQTYDTAPDHAASTLCHRGNGGPSPLRNGGPFCPTLTTARPAEQPVPDALTSGISLSVSSHALACRGGGDLSECSLLAWG